MQKQANSDIGRFAQRGGVVSLLWREKGRMLLRLFSQDMAAQRAAQLAVELAVAGCRAGCLVGSTAPGTFSTASSQDGWVRALSLRCRVNLREHYYGEKV